MRYRTFVLVSVGTMLLTSVLVPLLLNRFGPGGDPVLGILGGLSLTVLVLLLDLAVWRFAPQSLERAGFRLDRGARQSHRNNAPVVEVAVTGGHRDVYRIDAGIRIIAYGVATVIALMGLGIGGLYLAGVDTTGRRPDIGPVGHTLFVLFFLLMAYGIVYTMHTGRLVLSPQGVEFRTLGYSIASSWENVRGIGLARYERGSQAESLLLREPGLRKHGPLGGLITSVSSVPGDAIPLESFGSPSYGPLARDLRRYAPHLFGADDRPIRVEGDP